jgi:hypothetical protein
MKRLSVSIKPEPSRIKDSRIPGFQDSRIPGFQDSRIPAFQDSSVPGSRPGKASLLSMYNSDRPHFVVCQKLAVQT